MKILGIDPGTVILGWCLAEQKKNKDPDVVQSGHLKAKQKLPINERLAFLHNGLKSLIMIYQPDHIIMESIMPVSPSRQASIQLGKSAGIIIAAAANQGYPIHETNVMTARKLVMNNGRAKKEEIRTYFSGAFKVDLEKEPDDTSDAILLAMAGFHLISQDSPS